MIQTTYIFTVMFAVLFLINLATLFGVCYTNQGERVIFATRLATALTCAASFICLFVTIALHLGVA